MIISSKSIKEEANRLGFEKVGIAKATATNIEQKNLEVWLHEKKHAGMDWLKKRKDERGKSPLVVKILSGSWKNFMPPINVLVNVVQSKHRLSSP